MDNLKKYLQRHRDELDEDLPGDAVWQRLQDGAGARSSKQNAVILLWRYAAAACVLAFVAAGVFYMNGKKPAKVTATFPGVD